MTGGPDTPSPEKKSQNIGFLSNTGLELQSKPAFTVAPLSADDGPLKVVFGSPLPSSTKMYLKLKVKFGPLGQNVLDPRMLKTENLRALCTD